MGKDQTLPRDRELHPGTEKEGAKPWRPYISRDEKFKRLMLEGTVELSEDPEEARREYQALKTRMERAGQKVKMRSQRVVVSRQLMRV